MVYMIIMAILSVRLDEDLEKRLNYLLTKRKITDKSAFIRQILDKALQSETLDVLAQAVQDRQMSIWKAAEIAQITLRQMMNELAKRNIFSYDEKAFQQDLDFLTLI